MTTERPCTVLLVEDDANDERIAMRVMSRVAPPLAVEVARDGEAALAALGLEGDAATATEPDLVICDLKLPKVRGDEVLQRVRSSKRLSKVPFIVFSSSDEPGDRARCEAFGATEYATKPIEFDDYRNRVADLLRRHLPACVA